MEAINYSDKGERLSLYKLLTDCTIHIPLIQRDYVQGRKDEGEVRNDFLKALKGYLDENIPFKDLDFVYGFLDQNNSLYPLDGQQRLTTLMLLHWFLACKEHQFDHYTDNFIIHIDGAKYPKFSYQNRISSKEFCTKLLGTYLSFDSLLQSDKNIKNSLSNTIKNLDWYAEVWNFDPTIQNILNMLDAMNSLFDKGTVSDYYLRLVDENNPIITFLFMDLGKNNLSDDLYIKMNSRGVQLTIFENFKAKLEKFISTISFDSIYRLNVDEKSKEVDFKTYYSTNLDVKWSNFVWNLLKFYNSPTESIKLEKFDLMWTNIFRISFIHSLLKNDTHNEALKILLNSPKQMSFYDYEHILNSDLDNNSVLNKTSLLELVEFLDILSNNINILSEFEYYDASLNFYHLSTTDYQSAYYVERLMFFSFMEYFVHNKDNSNVKDLKDWMRLVRNLVYNTAPYNKISEFENSIKVIRELVKYSNDIDEYLVNLESYNLVGFDKVQFIEEVLKRKLENKDNLWKNLIKEAELHPYLEGQINFLLILAGIDIDKLEFLENSHKQLQNIFSQDYLIFKELFNDGGLKIEYSKNGKYRFERALLSIGDYTLNKQNNKSFLVNNDRDISWKRFFKLEKGESQINILKSLFLDLRNNANDLMNGLQNIINKNQVIDDFWRFIIVRNSDILSYFDNTRMRFFRMESLHGFVLLKGERVSGPHAEIESYNFYLNEKSLFNFTDYYSVSGENNSDIPCAYIDIFIKELKYGIDIRFINKNFNIAVKNKTYVAYDERLAQLLITEGFSTNNIYFAKEVGDYEHTKSYLLSLIKKINIIQNN